MDLIIRNFKEEEGLLSEIEEILSDKNLRVILEANNSLCLRNKKLNKKLLVRRTAGDNLIVTHAPLSSQ